MLKQGGRHVQSTERTTRTLIHDHCLCRLTTVVDGNCLLTPFVCLVLLLVESNDKVIIHVMKPAGSKTSGIEGGLPTERVRSLGEFVMARLLLTTSDEAVTVWWGSGETTGVHQD
uniref:Non-catalytic module family EXPN n=1 Tax=Phakopsora pachyrhizi TaxID=170000 RepID=A0A0S1MIT7_PHAPC